MELGLANVLVLPLLGGYLFVTRCNLTSYRAARFPGQRLLLTAAAGGVILLVIARLIVLWVDAHARGEADTSWIVAPALTVAFTLLMAGLAGHARTRWLEATEIGRVESSTESQPIWETVCNLPKTASANLSLAPAVLVGELVAARIYYGPTGLGEALLSMNASIVLISVLLTFVACGCIARHAEEPIHVIAFRLGLIALVLLSVTVILMDQASWVQQQWEIFSPVEFSGTTGTAFALGFVSVWPINFVYSYQNAFRRLALVQDENALDRLLYTAALKGHQVQVTLNWGKIYIGYVEYLPPNPRADEAYLRILPTISGYRDGTTKQAEFTTYYDEVYMRLSDRLDSTSDSLQIRDFLKIVPIRTIVSASLFDAETYAEFGPTDDFSEADGAEIEPDR